MATATANISSSTVKRPRRRAVLALSAVAFLSCTVAVALARLAPDAAPVRAGSAQDYWDVVCGVKRYPPGDLASWEAYATRHGAFLYENSGLESTTLYEAPEADVRSQFEQVVAKLGDPENSFRPYVVEGFKMWQDGLPQTGRTPESLVNAINEALFSKVKAEQPRVYYYNLFSSDEVEGRLVRANWFWAAIVFEWTFLTGLLLWVSWPIIRGGGRVRWAVHLGAVPFLLYLPLYFDYAPYLYTTAGPSGGILYPWFVEWFHGIPDWPLGQWDTWILRHTPPLLETLSPKLGPIMAMTRWGIPGPAQMAGIGAFLALLIFLAPLSPRVARVLLGQLKAQAAAHRRALVGPHPTRDQAITDPASANQSAAPPASPAQ